MRRIWLGQLVLAAALGVLGGTARFARADDLPYAGAWKITVLQGAGELSVWLVKLDKPLKKIELISGINQYGKTKLSGLKAEPASLRFKLEAPPAPQGPPGTGPQEFQLVVYAPKGKDKVESMLGTIRSGINFFPVRIEKTELTEIDLKTATRPTGGFADLQAAAKTADPEDKIKDLEDVLKTYEAKPIVFMAARLLAAELIKKKAAADAFKPVAAAYGKTAAAHGREMEIQGNLDLTRMLLGYEKSAALALSCAEKAAALLEDADNRGVRLTVFMELANALAKNGKDDKVKPVLARITKITDEVIKKPRTPVPPLVVTQQMATMLLNSGAAAVREAGLEYARKTLTLLKDDSPLADKLNAHKLLHAALEACKKPDEAKKMTPGIDKMEAEFDVLYLKEAIPFKPEKFAGRKGKSQRVVLVETFTSANAPQALASTPAVDALTSTYSPKEVVVLQYHIPTPTNQPMVLMHTALGSPGVEARKKFYEDDVEGAPTTFVDGKPTAPLGGARIHARARYDTLRELIDKALETEAEAKLELTATRKGDKIDLSASVADLKAPSAQVKLFFVLTEERVRYPGTNGVRLHHHVVRAVTEGVKLEQKASKHTASIDLAELRKKIADHLKALAAKGPFPNAIRPMELKKLKVVALIQDDDTKKVFQAVQADVPENKD